MRGIARWLPVLALLALCGAPQRALAQIPRLGVKAGVNSAVLGGEDAGTVEHRTGLAFGGYVTVPLRPGRSLQAEALLTQKGARYAGASDSFTYLEAPILYRVSPVLPPIPFKPVLYAGPTAGILLTARMGNADAKHLYSDTDFGVAVGGGVEFARLSIDARYQIGLISIGKTFGQHKPDYKHRVFSVYLGYRLF